MTLAIILIVFAILALVFLGMTVSRSLQVSKSPELPARIQPVDIEAFRNLVNPDEDEHLRRRLPPTEFRRVQRMRLSAAAAYILVARRNAALLAEIGQAALNPGDAHTVAAATRLIDQAGLLQQNATVAFVRIYIAWLWPNAGLAARPVLEGYRDLSGAEIG